jgi:hypothetical protein
MSDAAFVVLVVLQTMMALYLDARRMENLRRAVRLDELGSRSLLPDDWRECEWICGGRDE